MIDPKNLREEGHRSIYEEWKKSVAKLGEAQAHRNRISDEIGRRKKSNADVSDLLKEMQEFKAYCLQLEEEQRRTKEALDSILLTLRNIPDPSVPIGHNASSNKIVRQWGDIPSFSFKPKTHYEIGTKLGYLDFDLAASLSGARFPLYIGIGAQLERAISRFMLDLHTKVHGYIEVSVPYLVTRSTITNTGQLPKFEDDLYKTTDDLFLIPTAEVPLTNLLADKTVEASSLPKSFVALTPCFRREAGSYGSDAKGLIRNHQFNKVELVRVCKPGDSLSQLEVLTGHAEEVLKRLKLPYRVVLLCTGDMGFSASKTFDLEVWLPGENAWREISSCSTCGNFQARRMNFRIVDGKKRELGCTLNGSGLAVGRTFAAILENFQREDGSINIPDVLSPYL